MLSAVDPDEVLLGRLVVATALVAVAADQGERDSGMVRLYVVVLTKGRSRAVKAYRGRGPGTTPTIWPPVVRGAGELLSASSDARSRTHGLEGGCDVDSVGSVR